MTLPSPNFLTCFGLSLLPLCQTVCHQIEIEFTFFAEVNFRPILRLHKNVFCIFKSIHCILFYFKFSSWKVRLQSNFILSLRHWKVANLVISFELPWNLCCRVKRITNGMILFHHLILKLLKLHSWTGPALLKLQREKCHLSLPLQFVIEVLHLLWHICGLSGSICNMENIATFLLVRSILLHAMKNF